VRDQEEDLVGQQAISWIHRKKNAVKTREAIISSGSKARTEGKIAFPDPCRGRSH
jgi:hypothetical protein